VTRASAIRDIIAYRASTRVLAHAKHVVFSGKHDDFLEMFLFGPSTWTTSCLTRKSQVNSKVCRLRIISVEIFENPQDFFFAAINSFKEQLRIKFRISFRKEKRNFQRKMERTSYVTRKSTETKIIRTNIRRERIEEKMRLTCKQQDYDWSRMESVRRKNRHEKDTLCACGPANKTEPKPVPQLFSHNVWGKKRKW